LGRFKCDFCLPQLLPLSRVFSRCCLLGAPALSKSLVEGMLRTLQHVQPMAEDPPHQTSKLAIGKARHRTPSLQHCPRQCQHVQDCMLSSLPGCCPYTQPQHCLPQQQRPRAQHAAEPPRLWTRPHRAACCAAPAAQQQGLQSQPAGQAAAMNTISQSVVQLIRGMRCLYLLRGLDSVPQQALTQRDLPDLRLHAVQRCLLRCMSTSMQSA
jgi:hypothetical protein